MCARVRVRGWWDVYQFSPYVLPEGEGRLLYHIFVLCTFLVRSSTTYPIWQRGSTVRFYRLRTNVNPLLESTITRSKVIASTLIRSTILRPTPNFFWNN